MTNTKHGELIKLLAYYFKVAPEDISLKNHPDDESLASITLNFIVSEDQKAYLKAVTKLYPMRFNQNENETTTIIMFNSNLEAPILD